MVRPVLRSTSAAQDHIRNHGGPASTVAYGNSESPNDIPGFSVAWSRQEQTILDDALTKFESQPREMCYLKIANRLTEKTVREVAQRWKLMRIKENGRKKRKTDQNLERKRKDKKERVTDPSAQPSVHLAVRPSVPPCPPTLLPLDTNGDISYKGIGGEMGQMLESNAKILDQIYKNISNFQLIENIRLFNETRENIRRILNNTNNIPGAMMLMPQIPVEMNEDLLNSVAVNTFVLIPHLTGQPWY